MFGWARQTEQSQPAMAAAQTNIGAADQLTAPETKASIERAAPDSKPVESLQQPELFLRVDLAGNHVMETSQPQRVPPIGVRPDRTLRECPSPGGTARPI